MGNKGHKRNKSETVIEEQQIELDHSKLKDMKFKKTRGGQYMEGSFVMHNKDDYQRWEESLKTNPGASSSDVLNPKKTDFKQNKMCGSGGKAKVVYDTFPFLLNYEITNRANREHKKKFEESQLWYLVHTLANVGDQYHQAGQKVGNISPENVFLNENGLINIASKYSWPNQKTNYEDALYDKQITYLAPEQTKDLQIGRKTPIGDFRLAESFSAGLTALDAALLEDSKDLYSSPRGFDEEMLEGKKQNLRNQPYYNDQIKHVILNLLQMDPNRRMTLSQMKNWLASNSQSILNLEGFRPNTYTHKLAETANQYPVRSKNNFSNQGFYKTNAVNNYSISGPQYNIRPVSSPSEIKKLTKTVEVPGGPTQSSRPRKNPKPINKKRQNPISTQQYYEPRKIQSKVQSISYNFENRLPANSYNRESQSTYQVLQRAPYQPSQTYRYDSDLPKTRTSLETIEQKIRQSRMNFPDI